MLGYLRFFAGLLYTFLKLKISNFSLKQTYCRLPKPFCRPFVYIFMLKISYFQSQTKPTAGYLRFFCRPFIYIFVSKISNFCLKQNLLQATKDFLQAFYIHFCVKNKEFQSQIKLTAHYLRFFAGLCIHLRIKNKSFLSRTNLTAGYLRYITYHSVLKYRLYLKIRLTPKRAYLRSRKIKRAYQIRV